MTEEKSDVIRIGINGFGRIGRMVMRVALMKPNVQIVGVNDPFLPPDYMAYQFKYDSTHGTFQGNVGFEATDGDEPNYLTINDERLTIFACMNPADIDWNSLGVQVVIDSTGLFLTNEKASPHLGGSVTKVCLSAPSKDDTPMFVMGVNHQDYVAKGKPAIFSNASCTTNALAPVTKVLDQEWTIVSGLMTTVHAVTATQKTVDAPSKKWRAGRGAFQNIIPSTTGAAKAVGKVYPPVNGKIDGMAFRVPVPNGSVVDLTVTLAEAITKEQLCAKMREWSEGEMLGVLGYTEDEIVSSDIIGDPHSSIFDAGASMVCGESSTTVKVITWYDNEWGYSNRLLDLISHACSCD